MEQNTTTTSYMMLIGRIEIRDGKRIKGPITEEVKVSDDERNYRSTDQRKIL